jgi:hypothetical protein
MIVFGGYWWDGDEHYLNDTWSLDLTTWTWKKLIRKGTSPNSQFSSFQRDEFELIFPEHRRCTPCKE